MILVVANINIKDGRQVEFLSSAARCIEATVQEKGNISYELKADVFTSNQFTFVEEWESKEALDLHMLQPHYKAFKEETEDLFENAVDVKIYDATKVN